MDLNTFNDCLDRLGPDLSDWPADLREAGERFAASSPEAADALADARTLANLLAAMSDMPAPPGLADRIAQRATDPWQSLLDWLAAALWRPVMAAGVPLALGFAIGLTQLPGPEADASLAAELTLLPFSTGYQELPYEE